MILHQHDISNYLACKKKFDLSYNQGWKPKKMAKHLSIGGLFHESAKLYYLGYPIYEIWAHIDEKESELVQNVTNQEQVDAIETNKIILQSMIGGYVEHFFDFEKCFPEYTVNVPVLKHRYINTLDGRVVEAKETFILEIKTASSIQTSMVENLPTNFQIKSYYWALQKFWLRKPVKGIIYRWVKKPTIRQKQKETLEQFRQRLMLEYLNEKEKYFYEERIYFDNNLIKDFDKEIKEIFRDLQDRYKTKRWFKEPATCQNYGGCQFLPYCNTGNEDVLKTFYEKEARI